MSKKASSSAMDESQAQGLDKNARERPNEKEELDEEDLHNMDSYHNAEIGDVVSSRFRILRKLGQGQFSNVWLCRDVAESKFIALKVVRSKPYYNDCAYHEINMLEKIQTADPSDRRRERLVKLSEHFRMPSKVEGTHVCLVFKTIGNDLLSFIRERYSNGVPMVKVKSIIRQILEGVDYLHSKCGVIHTDLKPENILICFDDDDHVGKMINDVIQQEGASEGEDNTCGEDKINDSAGSSFEIVQESGNAEGLGSDSVSDDVQTAKVAKEKRSTCKHKCQSSSSIDSSFSLNLFSDKEIKIKINDFGNSCSILEHLSSQIQTRHYRSPEVLIGADYGTPVDIWSIGCIAFELATGNVLFNPPSVEGYSKDEIHVALMVQVLGNIPKAVRNTGSLSPDYFLESGDLINVDTSKRYTLNQRLVKLHHWTPRLADQFSEFLMIMLQYDPKRRATAAQCLQHRWLKK